MQPIKGLFTHYANYFAPGRVLKGFHPKVKLCFDKGDYRVKTVERWEELERVLKLRYEVFHKEYMNKKLPFGIDVEHFDGLADHLIIIDRRTNKLVGTYRLICSESSKSFYSQTEFFVDAVLALPGTKLELSRACIHRNYRTGPVMNLLWRGLIQYIQAVDAKFLFGCSSVKTMDPKEIEALYHYLVNRGAVLQDLQVTPIGEFRMKELEALIAAGTPVEAGAVERAKALVPPLLNSYLRAGAKVCGTPALDRAFKCIDFLTLLRMEDLTRLYERKYAPC